MHYFNEMENVSQIYSTTLSETSVNWLQFGISSNPSTKAYIYSLEYSSLRGYFAFVTNVFKVILIHFPFQYPNTDKQSGVCNINSVYMHNIFMFYQMFQIHNNFIYYN